MNRYILLQHLARARQHVAIGEVHLARQYEIIAEFERDGHDAAEAKRLLAQFIVMQALHIEDCRRLERDLEKIESDPTSNSIEPQHRSPRCSDHISGQCGQ
ncbi:MAG: hypothetical protein WCD69_11295 [Xanthobacteraceae bacterium]|jgi:hemoglobin-like flavoprotein